MLVPSTIYLCGPIADRTDEQCIDWREEAKRLWLGFTLDPMRRDYRGVQMTPELSNKVVLDDLDDIHNSDGLLVMYDKPSVGTSMEIVYAFQTGKKVVLVNVSDRPVEMLSPWLIHHCDAIVNTLAEGVDKLEDLIYDN